MFDKKQYMKEYREKNKDYNNKYMGEYRKKNREQLRKYHAEYRKSHPEMAKLSCKKYYQNNKEKVIETYNKWKKANPEKYKAMNRLRYLGIKDSKCSSCGSTKRLEFHHTNYEKDEGFTVCRICHIKVHKKYCYFLELHFMPSAGTNN